MNCIDNKEVELDSLLKDALRYRWLKSQKCLNLQSDNMRWIRQDGTEYTSSHILCGNGVAYGSCETLDETIDDAMKLK